MTRGADSLSAVPPGLRDRALRLHAEGITLYRQDRFEQALACYDAALGLVPAFPALLNSKGFLLQDLDRMEEAVDCFERAVALAPEFDLARLNLGLAQLKLGQWESGWENYEYRWTGSAEAAKGSLQQPSCPLPMWNGETGLEDRSLLVITEQGFGDSLQFARYLPLAARRFRKVGFVCAPPLQRLLEWSMGDDLQLSVRLPGDFEAWDFHCPLMSLPRAFQTRPDTVPATLPYLRASRRAAGHWQERLALAAPGRFRIGIAWAGRKAHQYDHRRSLRFEQVLPLLGDSRVSWVSLQKWAPDDARPEVPAGLDWIDWTDELTDFADSAALVSGLDLVITVDSALAHLAGGLGRPVWLLNRYDSEWRWGRRQTSSPWYSSMRIFNQPAFGDWPGALAEAQAALAALEVPAAPRRQRPQRGAPPPVPRPVLAGLDTAQIFQRAIRQHASGRLREAAAVLEQLLEREPTHAPGCHLAGVVAFQIGQVARAEAFLARAVAQQPDSALYHANLAEACRLQGKVAQAVAHGERAVALDPSLPAAHGNLGHALCDAGDPTRAAACHERALALAPRLLQSLNGLGNIARKRGEWLAAAQWFRRALALDPEHVDSRCLLAEAQLEAGQLEEVANLLDPVLQRAPDQVHALALLGALRARQGRADEASAALQRVLKLAPGHRLAQRELGKLAIASGNSAGGLELLEAVVAADPEDLEAHCARLLAGPVINPEPSLGIVSAALSSPATAPSLLPRLHEALGRVADGQGDFTAAVAHFEQANAHPQAQPAVVPAEAARRLLGVEAGALAKLRRAGDSSTAPILLLGFPGSGLGMVERLLAAHPDVVRGGPLPLLLEVLAPLLSDPAGLDQLDRPQVAALGARYAEALRQRGPRAARITDAGPGNVAVLGLLPALLPNARLVVVQREPLAACFTHFRHRGGDYAALAGAWALHQRLLAHWQALLGPNACLLLEFEQLLGDPGAQTARVLEWCGLAPDPRCAETVRPGASPRWRAYGGLLSRLAGALQAEGVGTPDIHIP